MTRLTKDISNKQSYCQFELKDCKYQDIYSFYDYNEIEDNVDCDLTLAIDKLGEIENIMQEFHIADLSQLRKSLEKLKNINKVMKGDKI